MGKEGLYIAEGQAGTRDLCFTLRRLWGMSEGNISRLGNRTRYRGIAGNQFTFMGTESYK